MVFALSLWDFGGQFRLKRWWIGAEWESGDWRQFGVNVLACGRGEWIFELTCIVFLCRLREMDLQWHQLRDFSVAACQLQLLRRPPLRLRNEILGCGRWWRLSDRNALLLRLELWVFSSLDFGLLLPINRGCKYLLVRYYLWECRS